MHLTNAAIFCCCVQPFYYKEFIYFPLFSSTLSQFFVLFFLAVLPVLIAQPKATHNINLWHAKIPGNEWGVSVWNDARFGVCHMFINLLTNTHDQQSQRDAALASSCLCVHLYLFLHCRLRRCYCSNRYPVDCFYASSNSSSRTPKTPINKQDFSATANREQRASEKERERDALPYASTRV